jgi:hypothetical protein
MTGPISLIAVDAQGAKVPVNIHFPQELDPTILVSIPSEPAWTFSGSDLFECLINARLTLESHDLLLCCQGARADVFPSGMQRQMDLGRVARVLTRDVDLRREVDIFAPAAPDEAVSVEQQKAFVYRFFNLSP